ncbi:MAG: hypothetical protein RBS80_04210 [Thermoguttaceae bacterium]|jgi:hypothetical protein|nr:hypothetical protein [Thermoguttaceae bacterium]
MFQGVPVTAPAAEEPGTWAEAMLAGRAACRAAPPASEAGRAAEPFDSGPVAGDGPGVQVSVDVSGWQWMRLATELREGGAPLHLLDSSSTHPAPPACSRLAKVYT